MAEAQKKEAKEDPKVVVPKLLKQLEATEDQAEKRKLRQRLRSMGHYGGILRKDDNLKKPKLKDNAPAQSKGRRAVASA